MIGLSKTSKTKEMIVRVDKNTAIKYFVGQRKIDLKSLKREKKMLEEQLSEKEPTKEELIELGRTNHPYYTRDLTRDRLKEIDSILGK
jgi:ribosomal protein L1